jgi:RimJ/RimL family protein N-acetyltransferase
VATTALRLFLDLVTTRSLYALVVKHNVASIRVLEKFGFTREPIEDADDEEVMLKLEA